MSKCVVVWIGYTDEYHPINCPNCGRFLKYDPLKEEFTCRCNRIMNVKGDSSGDFVDDALRVCKIPEKEVKR